MDELQAQITDELRRILALVEELTGLTSRWSGVVELVPNAEYRGKKRFSCFIQLDAALAGTEERWLTLIHEALHCISVGYIAADYREYPGWEEGVVEQMQRMLRPRIFARLGVTLDPAIVTRSAQEHRYNAYIAALESLRETLDVSQSDFYSELLQTPIKQRPAAVFRQGDHLSGTERFEFIKKYSVASAVLRGFTTTPL